MNKSFWRGVGACLVVSSASAGARADETGAKLFEQALPETNGRSCATCHVLDEHTALAPANVARRLAENPRDPLFLPLDADDPSAAVPSYEHLKKGLIRVTLTLPDNMDVIDAQGRVVTAADRTIFVWRGVPSVENVAYSAPYQLDGRERDLPSQAQSAITSHSEGPTISRALLDGLAEFQLGTFSSERARFVARQLERGRAVEEIPTPEQHMRLDETEQRGREVFELACAGCHGAATTRDITDRVVRDALFFALDPRGNIIYDIARDGTPQPRNVSHPDSDFLNIGTALLTGYGQLGIVPMFNDSLELPRYRFRFYRDGTRTQQVVDLPPLPVTATGAPQDIAPVTDERGAPILGPSLGVQAFSTDPGRAAITGDPLDFETFDVPQLRGIAHTAPYFHDNSAERLEDVVDMYSRFILPFPALELPPIHPPEVEGGAAESLSRQQKTDLLAFLRRL